MEVNQVSDQGLFDEQDRQVSDDLKKYAQDHFNEIVISTMEIGRVVGYFADEMDMYVLIKHPNGILYKYMGLTWVTEPITLKGKVDDDRYSSLEMMMELNGCEAEPKLLTEYPHPELLVKFVRED